MATPNQDNRPWALSLPSWIRTPKAWDKPSLGNVQLPGIVVFRGITIQLRVEKNKCSGADGGGGVIKGLELPQFQFDLALNSQDEEDTWNRIAPLLLPRKDPRTRGVLPVYHPTLVRFQIRYCLVEKLVETPPNAGGPLLVQIQCLAVTPKKSGATKSVTSQASSVQGPDAIPLANQIPNAPNIVGYGPPSKKTPLQ